LTAGMSRTSCSLAALRKMPSILHSAVLFIFVSVAILSTGATDPTGQPTSQPSLRPTKQNYYYYYDDDDGDYGNDTRPAAPSTPSHKPLSVGALVGIVLSVSFVIAFAVYIFLRKPPWLPCFRAPVQPAPAVATVAATVELMPLDVAFASAELTKPGRTSSGATYVIPTARQVAPAPSSRDKVASANTQSVSRR